MKIKPALAATAITAAALLPGAAVIAAGKAHADPLLDTMFVNTVCGDAGICRQPHMMIAAGLKLCYDLQTPSYTVEVAIYDIWVNNPYLSSYQAGYFVGASMAAYCPERVPAGMLV